MIDGATLFQRFSAEKSGEAFAELVCGHLPLDYSSAIRQLDGDAHGPEDMAQGIFLRATHTCA